MLKRLRNKILVLNMLLTTVVVAIAFAFIYLVMDSQIQAENKRKLDAITEGKISFAAQETNTDGSEDAVAADTVQQRLPADYALSFHVKLDPYGKLQNIDSLIDLPEASYHLAAETAWKHKDGHGPISINGRLWQYAVVPATSTQVINENGMQTIIAAQDGSYQISFLDVTGSMETLRTLAITFVFVILAVLAAIFLISLMFANRSIRPVSEAWEKQRQFVADASHELKTPLSIINANYDVLVSNQNETIISQIKWLEYMKAGTDRMTELIHSLLSLARLESETAEINKVPFNISSKVSDIIESMAAALHEKNNTHLVHRAGDCD